jgi:hypothetical protein
MVILTNESTTLNINLDQRIEFLHLKLMNYRSSNQIYRLSEQANRGTIVASRELALWAIVRALVGYLFG